MRYADTDAMGVVYYGTYLSFFEAGRVEAMRQVGALYDDLVSRGVHSPVVEAHVRYRVPGRFDDLLLIHSWITDLGRVKFSFAYDVRREADGACIATGSSVHACVDARTLRPVRIPDWVSTSLNRLRLPA